MTSSDMTTRRAPDSAPHLALFMSNGGSLCAWERANILSREIALYLEFLRSGLVASVIVFSYDFADRQRLADAQRADQTFNSVRVVTPPRWCGAMKGLAAAFYSFFGVVAHRRRLLEADWFKTNQMSGAWAAIFAKWVCNRRLLIRQGYSLSRRFAKNNHALRARLARAVETAAYAAADAIAVTSTNAADALRAREKLAAKVNLLPTYVDTSLFAPKDQYDFDEPVLYVGRFEPQKNLIALVEGCRQAGRAIDLVGGGSLEPELLELAAKPGPPVRLLGSVANETLPEVLRRYTVFALTSRHEGLPKVLIEAMSSGLVCVGSPIPGVTDLIDDHVTGYLTEGLSSDEIAATIALAYSDRRADVGRAGHAMVERMFNLQHYARQEARLYSPHDSFNPGPATR
ncbi:MAG: glycosyltransferase family 4 protein [Pseudomonadota bacterium]